jgi:hypothetical protein
MAERQEWGAGSTQRPTAARCATSAPPLLIPTPDGALSTTTPPPLTRSWRTHLHRLLPPSPNPLTLPQDAFLERHGVKLGFMSAFVKAAAQALQEIPAVNAVIDGDEIVYRWAGGAGGAGRGGGGGYTQAGGRALSPALIAGWAAVSMRSPGATVVGDLRGRCVCFKCAAWAWRMAFSGDAAWLVARQRTSVAAVGACI